MLCLGLIFAAQAQELPEAPAPEPKPILGPRTILALTGIAELAAGAYWFAGLGDSLRAGDRAAILGATGVVTLGGSLLGALDSSTGVSENRVHNPTASFHLAPNSTTLDGESRPSTLSFEANPRLTLSPRTSLVVLGQGRALLGTAQDSVLGAPSLERQTTGGDLQPELRVCLGPCDIEMRLRTGFWFRNDHLTYPASKHTLSLQRLAWLPATLGTQIQITPKQRFQFYVGPRWDHLHWQDQDGEVGSDLAFGATYSEATYVHDLTLSRLQLRGMNTDGRWWLGYRHSNFDGAGLDFVATQGMFGPITAGLDLRAARPDWKWALQMGVETVFGVGGGVGIRLGVAAPDKEKS